MYVKGLRLCLLLGWLDVNALWLVVSVSHNSKVSGLIVAITVCVNVIMYRFD